MNERMSYLNFLNKKLSSLDADLEKKRVEFIREINQFTKSKVEDMGLAADNIRHNVDTSVTRHLNLE